MIPDLFEPYESSALIQPWKPRALEHDEWPCDYRQVYEWRRQTILALQNDPDMQASAHAYYSTRPGEFIMHWMDTYDPRKDVKWMPFIFFTKQYEIIEFFDELRKTGENGLIEKCRDAGVTWLACGYSVWAWLFIPEVAIGWGSRKQELVDRIGDASSIFEKLRLLINRLPRFWWPEGLRPRDHLKSMNLTNPENGASIIGEIGRNIGRGGRTSIYFKDESAHYEHPEDIEAALGDNTNTQVDISSVNGLGNVFHRRREGGEIWQPGLTLPRRMVRVNIVDWRDHPEKTQQWYDEYRAQREREGLLHLFAQEIDRDYGASQANRLIDAPWIEAAIDAHLNIPYLLQVDWPETYRAGFDVAEGEEGGDKNALVVRQAIIARLCEEWGDRDPAKSAQMVASKCLVYPGCEVEYDSIGVGVAVKIEYNRLMEAGVIVPPFNPWSASAAVIDPLFHYIENDDRTPLNRDMFGNFKAQAWWHVRTRFYKTWRAREFGEVYPWDELISLDSNLPLLHQLKKELAQVQQVKDGALRMIIDKKPDGTRSPNCADALVMSYFPTQFSGGVATGSYGV